MPQSIFQISQRKVAGAVLAFALLLCHPGHAMARVVIGEKAPRLVVERWVGPKPNTEGKMVLINFWATWCPGCREEISNLNHFHDKFWNNLVVIGLTDDSEQDVIHMVNPKIKYSVAIDSADRLERAANVTEIPWVLIIDPAGVARWIGFAGNLDDKLLKKLIKQYGNDGGPATTSPDDDFDSFFPKPLPSPQALPTPPPVLPTPSPAPAQTSAIAVTIPANSANGYSLGAVRKGTKITFQYSGGKWKSWGKKATASPDEANPEGGDKCRLAIAVPGLKGGSVVAVVPAGTQTTGYVFLASQDYPSLILRINSKSFKGPGKVEYALKVEPPAM